MAKATNTVFVYRTNETATDVTLLRTFGVTEDVKTPLKAAKRWLATISRDETHALYNAFHNGELFYMGGHPKRAEETLRAVIA